MVTRRVPDLFIHRIRLAKKVGNLSNLVCTCRRKFVVKMSSADVFEKLQITEDEADRLKKAFQNEEFRKLFKEYAEEIADPENRKRYEQEIQMMENERGMDVKFVNPEPGYVIKICVDGEKKAFINIAQNNQVEKPSSSMASRPDGTRGMQWSIPHSFSPPREDLDKKGTKCTIYDFVINPDTFRMAQSNQRFREMIQDTAFDGIERQFDVKIDRKNLKFPKMKYKGVPTATVIRTRNEAGEKEKDQNDLLEKFPYPYDNQTSEEKAKKAEEEAVKREEKKKAQENKTKKFEEKNKRNDVSEPKYSITHRTEMDMQEFTNSPNSTKSTRPKFLVIDVDLPLLKSAGSVDLDIFEKKMILKSEKPAKYYLELNLPFPVDEDNGSAKFDKTKHKLVVTLPVMTPSKNLFMNGNSEVSDAMNDSAIASMDEDGEEKENLTNGLNHECTPPLIEVIASEENTSVGPKDERKPELNEKVEDDKSIWNELEVSSATLNAPKISYLLPRYDYHQNDKSVSFIFHARNVKQDTVSKSFPGPTENLQGILVKFASIGAGGFPIHFSFLVQFPLGCRIDPQKTVVDVSTENVVLVVFKEKECCKSWDMFHAGKDAASLEEKLFLTDRNLATQLEDLESDTMPSADADLASPDLEVTDMNDNKLTVNVKYKSSSSNESGSPRQKTMSESGDDIEVVHEKQIPKLHSILKQRSRTTSESSDEVFNGSSYSRENSVGHDSPISESDETQEDGRERKKSVSFSEAVDKTSYKTAQSVSMLHTTLKNKRKRVRKREQKKEDRIERRRRRSSGSMSSDADDNNASEAGLKCDVEGSAESTEDSSASSPEVVPENGTAPLAAKKSAEKSKKKNKKNKGGKKDESATEAHEPLETSEKKNGESEKSEASPVVSGAKQGNKAAADNSGEINNSAKGDEANIKKPSVKLVSNEEDSDDDDNEQVNEKVTGQGDTRDLDGRTKSKDPDAPDTILSWKEKEEALDPLDHKPQCAFSFANSLMYDLDDD